MADWRRARCLGALGPGLLRGHARRSRRSLLFSQGKGPFGNSLGLGLLAVGVLGLLAGFLVTVAWRLLSYLLGGKEAPYLIHPVIGTALGVFFGLMSTVVLGFTLVSGGSLRHLVAAPLLFFGFAWQQARS